MESALWDELFIAQVLMENVADRIQRLRSQEKLDLTSDQAAAIAECCHDLLRAVDHLHVLRAALL
jgi:hypothetical protein